jgi:DNA-binding transcriptional LysR family regulator
MALSLTLRQFEIFSRVAELRSFSAAALVLHVSQPALTRSIQQMEEALGARLFDRDTRNIKLTAVGNRLLPIAHQILGDLKIACTEMTQFVEGLQGKVHIAALPCVAAALLPTVIADFNKSHPDVEFRVSELLSQNVADSVTDNACDFGIAVRPSKHRRVAYDHLIDDELFMVCRSDDALASRSSVQWNVFEGRRFIALGRNCSVRATTEDILSELQIDLKHQYECQNTATARSMIEAGLGIGAVTALMLPQVAFGKVIARPLIQPGASRSVGIITQTRHSMAPAAQMFFDSFVRQAHGILKTVVPKSVPIPRSVAS